MWPGVEKEKPRGSHAGRAGCPVLPEFWAGPGRSESLQRGVPTRARKWQWEDAKDSLECSIFYMQRAGVGIQLPFFFPRVSSLLPSVLVLLLFPHSLASSLHGPFPISFLWSQDRRWSH